jgi:hypothetical protein
VEAGIRDLMHERLPDLLPTRLFSWSCMGKSEAALGEITEAALAGSGLLTGYRAHIPFVEVKVWVPERELKRAEPYLAKLEAILKPWAVTRNGNDLGATMVEHLAFADEVEIYDSATAGVLGERLGSLLRRPGFERQAATFDLHTCWVAPESPSEWVSGILAQAEAETVCLAVAGFTPQGEWAIGLRHGATLRTEELTSPFKLPGLLDRARRYAVEITFKRVAEWLEEAFH